MPLSLLACASPSTVKEYVYVYRTAPGDLLLDCRGYTGPLESNGDLAEAYQQERLGLEACNKDKAALRDWSKGNTP